MLIGVNAELNKKRLFKRDFYLSFIDYLKTGFVEISALTLVYFLAARFGLSLAISTEQVTLIWPPAGIALVALLLFGFRLWPGIFIGAFAANLLASEPLITALGIAAGNTLSAVAATYLLNRFAFQRVFEHPSCIFKFLFLGAFFAPLISATVGGLNLALAGLTEWSEFFRVWITWWTGDMMGILILSPLLLTWSRKENRDLFKGHYAEAFALLLGILGVCMFIFLEIPSLEFFSPRPYLIYPFLVWAAIRFTRIGAATGNFVIAVLAVWATALDYGPFVNSPSTEINLFLLLFYVFVFAATSLFAAAVITQGQKAERLSEHQFYHDTLTGLSNRVYFTERVRSLLNYGRNHKNPFSVLMIDMDRFKSINDSLGHESGDRLLVEVAKRLEACLPRDSIIARMGGDEFIIAVPEFEDSDQAVAVSKKIQASFQTPFLFNEQEIYLTCSIGIASYPDDGDDEPALLRNAYAALYRAKATGRNNYQFYIRSLNSAALEQLNLGTALRRAVKNGELEVHYWPQIDIDSGKILKNEALLRWRHPIKGLITAEEFIYLAESTGLIEQIDEWMMEQAFRQTAAWQRAGAKVGIAVNVSALEFQRKHFTSRIKELLKTNRLAPESLELELTERVLMENSQTIIKTLRQLKDLGVEISIDDFNTGYSSVNYIKQFPIDTLKIDRSFVAGLPNKKEDCAIARSIIDLARGLNKQVVAEGVERLGQLKFLQANGCSRIQGYLFSKPLHPEEMEHVLFQKEWAPLSKLKV